MILKEVDNDDYVCYNVKSLLNEGLFLTKAWVKAPNQINGGLSPRSTHNGTYAKIGTCSPGNEIEKQNMKQNVWVSYHLAKAVFHNDGLTSQKNYNNVKVIIKLAFTYLSPPVGSTYVLLYFNFLLWKVTSEFATENSIVKGILIKNEHHKVIKCRNGGIRHRGYPSHQTRGQLVCLSVRETWGVPFMWPGAQNKIINQGANLPLVSTILLCSAQARKWWAIPGQPGSTAMTNQGQVGSTLVPRARACGTINFDL